jgi:hypothetical protein
MQDGDRSALTGAIPVIGNERHRTIGIELDRLDTNQINSCV